MASLINNLNKEWLDNEKMYKKIIEEKDKEINELKAKLR